MGKYIFISTLSVLLKFSAISQSIYTEVNPSQVLCSHDCDESSYEIDFNNDGITDLKLWFDSYKFGAGCNSTEQGYLFSVKPIDTAELLMDSSSELAYLNHEDTVKENTDIIFEDYYCENDDVNNCPFLISSKHYNCEPTPSATQGHYGSFKNKYIGLKLKLEDDYHYCWIKVTKKEGVNLELLAYAYNQMPNEELVIDDPNYNSLETPLLNEIKCYPNPIRNHLSIQLGTSNSKVEVSDIFGKIIHEKIYSSSNFSLSTSSWSRGVYFVNITTDKGSITKKIIKK